MKRLNHWVAIRQIKVAKTYIELARYLIGGGSTALLNLALVWSLVEILGLNEIVSLNVSFCVVLVYSYAINKKLVFKPSKQSHAILFSKFTALQLSLVATTNILFLVLVTVAEQHYIAAIMILSAINAILNFVVMRKKIFITVDPMRIGKDRCEHSP